MLGEYPAYMHCKTFRVGKRLEREAALTMGPS